MKDLKKINYLILDMDGCVYHPRYLKTLFGQVSARMTEFIALKLDIDKVKDMVTNYECRQVMMNIYRFKQLAKLNRVTVLSS